MDHSGGRGSRRKQKNTEEDTQDDVCDLCQITAIYTCFNTQMSAALLLCTVLFTTEELSNEINLCTALYLFDIMHKLCM